MAKTDIKPVGNHVLIKRSSAAEVSAGGIVLPENAKEQPKEGTIVSVGNGKVLDNGERSSFTVTPGDRVIFASYAGQEVKHGGDEYLVMEESDILGVID